MSSGSGIPYCACFCSEGEAIALIQTWLPLALAGSLTADELTDASLHATLAGRVQELARELQSLSEHLK